jgi:GNAT superfamily N-acetyltransferase
MMCNENEQYAVILIDTADASAKAAASEALYAYNVRQTGMADRKPIGAQLSDPASGEVMGGLWGRTELGLLFIDMFFLPEHVRGHSQGSRLLAAVENEAIRRGCKRAVVETSSFQAPGFYERHGYREFGRVEFGAPGARVFLRKSLVPNS